MSDLTPFMLCSTVLMLIAIVFLWDLLDIILLLCRLDPPTCAQLH